MSALQRYTRDARCPICDHFTTDPDGHCHGFLSDDGAFARCTRADGGDGALLDEKCSPPAYLYRRQEDGSYRPWTERPPMQPIRIIKPRTEAYSAPQQATGTPGGKTHPRPASRRTYAYSDTEGVEAVRAVAGGKKACYPRVRDHADAPWRDGTGIAPNERVYHRAALDARPDERVHIVEGEGCADALDDAGALAITWRGGTAQVGKAVPQIVDAVRGRDVVLVPDADAPGRSAMLDVAMALRGVATTVRIIDLYQDESGRDIEDWLLAGGTAEGLRLLADTTPEYRHGDEASAGAGGWRPQITMLSDVRPEAVAWLWPGYIPLGKLTVIDGDPGHGKSTLMCDLAARVSTGRPMPDGSGSDLDAPYGVVLLSAEDGPADTIRPRLDAAGADATRIALLEGMMHDGKERGVTLADLPAIETAIARVDAKLILVDPLMAYLDSGTNSYRDQDVRGVLAPLARLADRTGAAIVVVRHFSKGQNANVLYRGGGSIGIIGAARVGLVVAPDPDEPDGPRRILAVAKSNLAIKPPAMAYILETAANGVGKITWKGTTGHTAGALFAAPDDEGERDKVTAAMDVLRTILRDGRVAAAQVEYEARKAGISDASRNRAKVKMGIKPYKEGFGAEGTWYWELRGEGGAEAPGATGDDRAESPKMLTEPLRCSPKKDEHLSHLRGKLSILAPESDPERAVLMMRDWLARDALDALPATVPLPDDLREYRERTQLAGLCTTYMGYLPGSLTARDAIVRLVGILAPLIEGGVA